MVLSADDVAQALRVLTEKSAACQGPANQITVINVALAVSALGPIPIVITRLSDIVNTAGTTIQQFDGAKSFTESSAQDSIFQAFREFVQVHQALLNILIGKGDLVPQLTPLVGPPLAAVLRQVESVVDTIAFELIDTCQAKAKDLEVQKNSLDGTIAKAIEIWSGTVPI